MSIQPNTDQKIAILDIASNTKTVIESKLLEGYRIQSIMSLTPVFDKILIVYSQPDIPIP